MSQRRVIGESRSRVENDVYTYAHDGWAYDCMSNEKKEKS